MKSGSPSGQPGHQQPDPERRHDQSAEDRDHHEGTAPTTYAVLVVAALLLAESFGWDVVWLWRRRLNLAGTADVLPAKVLEHGR